MPDVTEKLDSESQTVPILCARVMRGEWVHVPIDQLTVEELRAVIDAMPKAMRGHLATAIKD